MNTQTLRGNWNSARGKLKQQFLELTDTDLEYIEGQEDELFDRIQKRTGRSREAIEFFFEVECGCVGSVDDVRRDPVAAGFEIPPLSAKATPPKDWATQNDEQKAALGETRYRRAQA